MSGLHCWEDGPREHGEPGTTCMLEAGHSGPHEWTRDDQILVRFPAAEEAGGTMTRIEEIEAREKAATPGPWFPGTVLHLALVSDVEFAMYAREDIPYLLAQLEEAREERDRAVRELTAEVGRGHEWDEKYDKAIERAEAAERVAARRNRAMWQLTVDLIVANDAWHREDARAESAEALARRIGELAAIHPGTCPRCGGSWDAEGIHCNEDGCPLTPAEALEQRGDDDA